MEDYIIGVLGGIGPDATVSRFKRIVEVTQVTRDQDHIRIIIDNNPKMPDRTPAIFARGEGFVPMMVTTARSLERAGADFIVISCVSAHHFIDSLREAISIPILSIVIPFFDFLRILARESVKEATGGLITGKKGGDMGQNQSQEMKGGDMKQKEWEHSQVPL